MKAEKVFVKFSVFSLDVGCVWILAWGLNPNITSGTVWFVGILFALLQTHLSNIRERVSQ